MNILKTLITIFIVLVIAKTILDFICIGSNNILEGMDNKEKKEHTEKKNEKEQFPKANPHMAQNNTRKVPDDSINHKYKKYIPSNLDELPVKPKQYEEIGRDFLKDESEKRKKQTPKLDSHDAELLGKMVWRTYVAEIDQKRKNSPKAKDDVMSREIHLMNKVSEIIKSDTDHHKGKGKKQHSVANQASSISSRCSPKTHKTIHTVNMFTHIPKAGNDIEREHGYAFAGKPIDGTNIYYDLSNAIEHCSRDRACGGVNYDSTTGHYTLMPLHSKLEKRPHFTAFIKKHHDKHHNSHPKPHHPKHNDKKRHSHPVTGNDYLPVTGIGSPMNPNTLPRPFNSLYAIY